MRIGGGWKGWDGWGGWGDKGHKGTDLIGSSLYNSFFSQNNKKNLQDGRGIMIITGMYSKIVVIYIS